MADQLVRPKRWGWWAQWKRERACKRIGGHRWAPDPNSMVDYYCVGCGAEHEGPCPENLVLPKATKAPKAPRTEHER